MLDKNEKDRKGGLSICGQTVSLKIIFKEDDGFSKNISST